MVKRISLSEERIHNILHESIQKVLNERRGLQSKQLYNVISKLGKPYWSDVDLNLVTDDEIITVIERPLTERMKQEIKQEYGNVNFVSGNNYFVLIKYDKNKEKEYVDKIYKRDKNHNNSIDGAKQYRWHNKDAEDMIFKNPYFRQWDKEHQRKALDNVKNGKRYFEGFNESTVNEDVTAKQLKNASNRNSWVPNSVQIRNTSRDGEFSTVKMNRDTNFKKGLSRLVIKTMSNDGIFEMPKIINGNQDKLIHQWKQFRNDFKTSGYVYIGRCKDKYSVGSRSEIYIHPQKSIIKEIYLETDTLKTVDKMFDVDMVRTILERCKINLDGFKLPEQLPDKPKREKRPRIQMNSNWDDIMYGEPKKWNKMRNEYK